ncbi:MAG: hypothetical protein MR346_07630 [Clostridium sp.]|nr:hypothetical protein [Peptostreptococcaceae bacterium]MCI5629482.1 hypothetical protein [Clostridium sp.]
MTTTKKTTKRTTKAKENVEVKETETVVKRPKNFRELRKMLTRDTEVLIMNNTQGGFYYKCPKTHMEINMLEFGDTEVVTIELLEAMKNRARIAFKNYCIMIVDVYPEPEFEDVIEISDVLNYLGIADLYNTVTDELENNGDLYSEEFFDNLIINKSRDEFEKIAKKMNRKLLIQLAHRSVLLYQSGKFDSRYKMEFIQEKLGMEDLFTDM